MEEQIEKLLQELSELRAQLAQLDEEHRAEVEDILAPVAERLEEASQRYARVAAELTRQKDEVERQVRSLVLEYGQTYTSARARLQAVYARRVNWDTAKLDGLALAIPAILECRSETPYVQIREVKGAK